MKDLIQQRLEQYDSRSKEEELNALKEITQEVALYALQKVNFFSEARFVGGTSLRILHQLDRFSEDLHFSLKGPRDDFNLDHYLEKAMQEMSNFGYSLTIDEKDLSEKAVQSRFLKDDSIKNVLTFKHHQDTRTKIKIKIEVDTNPPPGAVTEVQYVDFPIDFMVQSYDLPSLMSGKLHALLCRSFVKGRDWYDFLWYLSKGVTPNYQSLGNAINQLGPWKDQHVQMDKTFLISALERKIDSLNWKEVSKDVRKFLKPEKVETLDLWSADFFKMRLRKAKFD